MKPEGRSSFINRSFRRSFRRKKVDEENEKSPEEVKAEQERAFAELKASVADILQDPKYDDNSLYRFLMARDYDVKEAEKLLRMHVSCQKFLLLDSMTRENLPEVVKKCCFSGFLGFDQEGCLIRVINYGAADLMGFINAISTVEILKVLIYCMQCDIARMREENKKTGRDAKQIVYIANLEHISSTDVLYKPVLDTELFALKLFQEHFYGITKQVHVVNAPAIFSTIYKMLKPAIQDNLRKRIKIHANDKWKEALLEHIDPEVLPVHFGGTRVGKDGDPKCSDVICYGSEVPQSLYESKKIHAISDDPSMKKLIVEAGAFVNIPVVVKEANSKFNYVVLSKDHDMSFALFYEPPDIGCKTPRTRKKNEQKDVMSRLEQITPFVRCQCHILPVRGHTVMWKAGTYMLHFDNTYSWMNPKEVYYKIELEQSQNTAGKVSALANQTKQIKINAR